MRITERQQKALDRMARDEDKRASLSPDLARQLIKKGLVRLVRKRQRCEWSRPVATLWVVCLITESN